MNLEWTTVPGDTGDLRALVHLPDDGRPLPGVVLVDGSGDGACDDWGGWPEWVAGAGSVVLTHDKPGSGGSPGDWTTQSIDDRAGETLAAVEVLRAHPACAGQPVGVLGFSQGGWVSLLAASKGSIDFIVSVSGPGVTPAVQERYRIERQLVTSGLSRDAIVEAMGWVDQRAERMTAGERPDAIVADQARHAEQPWYDAVSLAYDTPERLGFIAGIIDFDPIPLVRATPCPVLALFGSDDTIVPVAVSAATFAANLPELEGRHHGLAVFPGANHGLFVADPRPDVPRSDQLAPGFLPMLTSFFGAADAA